LQYLQATREKEELQSLLAKAEAAQAAAEAWAAELERKLRKEEALWAKAERADWELLEKVACNWVAADRQVKAPGQPYALGQSLPWLSSTVTPISRPWLSCTLIPSFTSLQASSPQPFPL